MALGRTNIGGGGVHITRTIFYYTGDITVTNYCTITQQHQSDWTSAMGSASYTLPTTTTPLVTTTTVGSQQPLYMGEYYNFSFSKLPFKPSKIGFYSQCINNVIGELNIGFGSLITPVMTSITNVTGSIAGNQRVSTALLYTQIDVNPSIDLNINPFTLWQRATSNLNTNIYGIILIK